MRILLVDDYRPFRDIVAMLLRSRLHADIVEAADGAAALEHVRQGSFDAIVLDVDMPGMDGEQTFARLPAAQADRTLILTGVGKFERRRWFATFPAGRVLRKPVDFEHLTTAITSMCEAV